MFWVIDMRRPARCDQAFSIWETRSKIFVNIDGKQCWMGESDFRASAQEWSEKSVERVVDVLPEWAKTTTLLAR